MRARVIRFGAPMAFVALWSTGFVGAKYGLPYAEPLTFLTVRLAIAAALLGLAAAVTRSALPEGTRGYRHAAVAGLLLHAGYLGGVFVAIDAGMPAGIAAVIVGLQPVLTAALAAALLAEPMTPRRWLGIALGFTGVALVVWPGLGVGAGGAAAITPAGLAACVLALAATTAGALYQRRYGAGVPLLTGAGVQYAAAALVLGVGAVATETMQIAWTPPFIGALAWLVLALSIGAVLLMLTLLRRGTATDVATLMYLVPPATALEAYFLFGETLGALQLVGMVLTVVGVACVLVPQGAGSAATARLQVR